MIVILYLASLGIAFIERHNNQEVRKLKKLLGGIVAVIGVVLLVFGIIFILQGNSGKQTVANEVKPLELEDVNPTYDKVSASFNTFMAAEEPKIQAKQAVASDTYNYLSAQRALLGLAKSNMGFTSFVIMSGAIDIVLGLGLLAVGFAIIRK